MLKTCESTSGWHEGHTFRNDPVMVTEWAAAANVGREGTRMLTIVNDDGTTPHGSLIEDIGREGARARGGRSRPLWKQKSTHIWPTWPFHLVAHVRDGARFERGHTIERPEAVAA
ncbi:hypothetical protein [Streptomyces sp. NPDC048508]|uniref:hypothetical protein n=1 Tax=Streptomyces sp. NPDC048508 TaxID=3365561 RepID=UPI003714527C